MAELNIDWFLMIRDRAVGFDYDVNKFCSDINEHIVYYDCYDDAVNAIR